MLNLPKLMDLCLKIEKKWARYDRDCEIFPDIVFELTSDFDFSELKNIEENFKLLRDPYVGSLQKPSSFSNLNMKLYESKNIYVELLHWWKNDITIHDHDFSGVQFQIEGSSLNVIYDFEKKDVFGRIERGKLFPRSAEVWKPGNRSVVNPGKKDPHMVMHLSEPTISLLIRTQPRPYFAPQKNYLFPSMSICYDVADSLFRKKLAAIDLLNQVQPQAFKDSLEAFLEDSSPTECFFILEKLQNIAFKEDNLDFIQNLSKKGQVWEMIVKSLIYRKAYNYLSKSIKTMSFLSDADRLGLSIIMASYDEVSRNKIIEDLKDANTVFDIDKTLSKISKNMDRNETEKFYRILHLFEKSYTMNEQVVSFGRR